MLSLFFCYSLALAAINLARLCDIFLKCAGGRPSFGDAPINTCLPHGGDSFLEGCIRKICGVHFVAEWTSLPNPHLQVSPYRGMIGESKSGHWMCIPRQGRSHIGQRRSCPGALGFGLPGDMCHSPGCVGACTCYPNCITDGLCGARRCRQVRSF